MANALSEKQMVNESKLAIKRFSAILKHTLKREMNKGSAANAINACHSGTEDINKQLIAQTGWKITRTALKYRNPNNAPDAWEQKVLQSFEKNRGMGAGLKQMQYSEIIKQGNGSVFRYMQVIPTAGKCLACHGEKIPAAVKTRLKELYPDDKATGFKVGDIRGAFSITRKVP